MKVEFKNSFLKSIQKINNPKLRESVAFAIEDVESAHDLNQISNLKKLKGYKEYYRIRIGSYRIGLKFENDIFIFAAFDDRKDIYKKFP